MGEFTEKDALELLEKHIPDKDIFDGVLAHSKAVQKAALEIANEVLANGIECDIKFIKVACLVHDIGRFKCAAVSHGGTNEGEFASLRHGVVGAEILKEEGWPEKFQRVCETHIGIGIRKKEIVEKKLPLPAKNYIPETTEEKVIAYVDNRANNDQIRDEQYVIDRYKKELGEEYAKKVIAFHEEIHKLIGNNKN